MNTSVIKRGVTIAGVAIGSAFLIGALAMAMRGLAPTASNASTTPAAGALRTLDRPAHRLVKHLASWHAPRVPKTHRHQTAKPVVVTVTAPPTVVPAPSSTAPTPTAAPASTESQGGGDDEHDDDHESEPGDE